MRGQQADLQTRRRWTDMDICLLQGAGSWIIQTTSGSRFKNVCFRLATDQAELSQTELDWDQMALKKQISMHMVQRGCSSVVEHNLAKVGVEGSNPFTRSNFLDQSLLGQGSSDCF